MPLSPARFLTCAHAAAAAPGRVGAGEGRALRRVAHLLVSHAVRGRAMQPSKSNRIPVALTERRWVSPLRHRLRGAWPGRA